jgi:signal transduction histidine kinase
VSKYGASGVRAAVAVEDRLFRALAVLRVITLLNAVAINVVNRDDLVRPWAGVVVLAAMAVWSGVVSWAYTDAVRRSVPLLVADGAVALAALALTPLAKGAEFDGTVPGFWVMSALLAWAVRFRLWGGLGAAVVIGLTDLFLRADITMTNYGNVYLLLIGGPIVGFLCGSLQSMAVDRERAQLAAAAATERARLARVVHDGVLQVLALVQRKGAELGGEAAELGRLAGEQEKRLRTLIRSQDALRDETESGTLDLADALARLRDRSGVDVAVPGGTVDLPAATVTEVVAVVEACLDNVARHVGEDAPAWVLLESFGDRVEVSVRDDGPGIPEGRLEEATAQGRLGVAESIRGRIADLGGTATLSTGSYGTEWEFTVPREAGPR